jgi:hypothetical protein
MFIIHVILTVADFEWIVRRQMSTTGLWVLGFSYILPMEMPAKESG